MVAINTATDPGGHHDHANSTARSSHQQRAPFEELRAGTDRLGHTPDDPEYDALSRPGTSPSRCRPAAVVAARTARTSSRPCASPARHGLPSPCRPPATAPSPHSPDTSWSSPPGSTSAPCTREGWARVGAGVKWLRVIEAAAPYGLAPLSGSITDVGVVGYTTGGGVGPMARTYGLAADRVRAFEVVTGDGVLRRVTPTEHPDLFFALRGGKGALGIVTAVEFDLVHLPTFYGGALWFDGDHAAAVIERWRDWSPSCRSRRPRRSRCSSCPRCPASRRRWPGG